MKRFFIITIDNKSTYSIKVEPNTTIFDFWIKYRSRFPPGSKIVVTDDKNNTKTFIKE